MSADDTSPLVVRNQGLTASERYLAMLCDRTFLRLWSYPNVFIDRGRKTGGEGKELCDLLVVCGDDVIIFSDKTIAWPQNCAIDVAWKRWYKRAIKKSADQVWGAERWINQFPEKLYLDRKCTQRFPIALPPLERRRVHGVVVALGVKDTCRKFFNSSRGSLAILAGVTNEAVLGSSPPPPFTVGDLCPSASFVHVLDDETLDIAMSELDTVTDFVSYLTKKEEFIRSGMLAAASGEEELVAYYATHTNEHQQHDFVQDEKAAFEKGSSLVFDGVYDAIQKNALYLAKKKSDEVSYVWDYMIDTFSKLVIDGTSVTPHGPLVLSDGEKCLRHMALLNRFQRRLLGGSIREAIIKGAAQPRFARVILPNSSSVSDQTAFFFLMLAVPEVTLGVGYEQYRAVRRSMMETYAFSVMQDHDEIRRVVGIATEPPGSKGSSQDLVLLEDPVWTPDLTESIRERRQFYGIMSKSNIEISRFHADEFPLASTPTSANREP